MPDDLWASFQIPIGLAFFMDSTVTACVVAMYPSPAGATESELHFDSWSRMRELNPVLRGLEPDIEGLIVNRLSDPPVYVIAPIDRCYALTGTIKAHWEGISGGRGVEEAVDAVLRASCARRRRRLERASPDESHAPRTPRGAARPRVRRCSAPARSRHAAAPMLTLDLQVQRAERAAGVHGRADDPADDRARAAPLRRRHPRAAGRAVRRARAVGGDHAQPRVVPARRARARVHRDRPRSRCRSPATTTSSSRRPSTCTRSPTARPRWRCTSTG